MAVFTPVTRDELSRWLESFDQGELLAYEGIASGIENSNFFVDTTKGRFVLTLFERLSAGELPFYLGLMHHLADHGIDCPDPIPARDGRYLSTLARKPAALVTRLGGRDCLQPGPAHCRLVGEVLARMHLAARGYDGSLPNLRGLPWWVQTAPRVMPHLSAAQQTLLEDELALQRGFADTALYASLPRTAVHADLFRDNVLFETDADGAPRLGGVIDFYFAGVDTWMFDLAVAANDWCVEPDGSFDSTRLAALLGAYRARRTPGDTELEAWPMMLRAAALRFWLSRLFDLHLPRPAEMVTPKAPAEFERILTARREHGAAAFPS
jgi:homoserine kinase type II